MRNGNFLKMRVSEIRVKRIRVNQGLGALYFLKMCPIFVGSVDNFGRSNDDMCDIVKK